MSFPISVEQIATLLDCPKANVATGWPLIEQCLYSLHIGTIPTYIAALATVKVETGKFAPIKELGGDKYLNDHYDTRTDLGNTSARDGDGALYCGRGYIQITGRSNYAAYGKLLGIDLVGHPELAMDVNVAAAILAAYFRDHRIADAAAAGDWKLVRRRVNGGTNGLADFLRYVAKLEAAVKNSTSSEAPTS